MAVISELKKRGKNLLDASKAETGSLVAADGSNFEKTNRARSPFVYLKKGTYTISMSPDIKATTMFFYSKPQPSGYFIGKYATTPSVENGRRIATFPVEQDCYMRCVFVPEDESKITDLSGETLKNYNVMISEGTTTDYLDITKYNNATIRNINIDGVDFHFAKPNEIENNICDNAVNEPIIDMQIKGNSVQQTYTGKNLFDMNNIEEGSILTLEGTDYDIENRYRLKFTYLKAGTYTFAINGNVQGGGYLHKYSSADVNSWLGTVAFSATKTVNGRNIRTATLDQDCYVRMVILPIGDQILSREYLLENKPQLEKSSTATSYEPYVGGTASPNPDYPQEIESVGEKTKNLLKLNDDLNQTMNGVEIKVNSDGTIVCNGLCTANIDLYIATFDYQIDAKYRCSGSPENGSTSTYRLFFNNIGSDTGYGIVKNSTTEHLNSPVRLVIYAGYNCNNLTFKPMVKLGTEKVDYEPYGYRIPIKVNNTTTNIYLKEPLRKIGDYSDVLDYKNKKVIRKIASEFLDTVTTLSGDATTYKKFLTNIKYKPYLTYPSGSNLISNKSIGHAISNKFRQSAYPYENLGFNANYIQTYITTAGISRCVYTFGDTSINTTEDAQEAIGDGFEICYVMADTIEETIEVPEIETLDGTTTLELETLEPSGISVNYWKQI